MYTILCKNKNLMITTKTAPIYKNDNRVDVLRFFVQPLYDDLDISNYTVLAQITFPVEGGKLEQLTFNEELYKGYLVSDYLVTNVLTQNVGNIKISLYIYYYNEETDKYHIMNTNSVSIEILESSYTGENVETEENVDILTQVQSQIADLQSNKLDNFEINTENNTIQFYANGNPIGEPVKFDNEVKWDGWTETE